MAQRKVTKRTNTNAEVNAMLKDAWMWHNQLRLAARERQTLGAVIPFAYDSRPIAEIIDSLKGLV